jgi:hypothetical protein
MKTGYNYPTMEWAQKAKDIARARFPFGSNNKMKQGPTSKMPGAGNNGGSARYQAINDGVGGKRGDMWGNCGDMAYAAYQYLKANKVLPVEVLHLGGARSGSSLHGDHVFCVLNRPKDTGGLHTTDEHIENWNTAVIICDPWANLVCNASEYPDLFAAKMEKWVAVGKDIAIHPSFQSKSDQKSTSNPGFFKATSWKNAIRNFLIDPLNQNGDATRQDPPNHYNVYIWKDFVTMELYQNGGREQLLLKRGQQSASPYTGSDNQFASKVAPLHLGNALRHPSLCYSFLRQASDRYNLIPERGHESKHGFLRCIQQLNHVMNANIPEDYTLYLSHRQLLERVNNFAKSNAMRVI